MLIGFLIVCLFLGLILAFILAPILALHSRKKLKEMDQVIDEFLNLPESEKNTKREIYQHKLIKIKGDISSADKRSTEKARDRLTLI